MQRPYTLYTLTAVTVILSILLGFVFLARTGLPSADVIARQMANRPIINVSDFQPGQVEIVSMNHRRVIVWRRNETDRKLAKIQNVPEDWRHLNSRVLGKRQPIHADDSNLTLNDEWFFALAEFSTPFQHLFPREGEFDGFYEGHYSAHFDLAGRIRKGPGSTNLTIIEAAYVNEGQGIQLYLDGKP